MAPAWQALPVCVLWACAPAVIYSCSLRGYIVACTFRAVGFCPRGGGGCEAAAPAPPRSQQQPTSQGPALKPCPSPPLFFCDQGHGEEGPR